MSDIHYFPRYSQRENFVTNNTLLLLYRLHQYNSLKFDRFMKALSAAEEIEPPSPGLYFRQQIGTGKSVVDGFIAQGSIKIAVETKLGNTFDVAQLRNHLALLRDAEYKLLILLSPSADESSDPALAQIKQQAKDAGIQTLSASFEELICHARACLSEHDEEMRALVDDYEGFCSDMNLLPTDRYSLFVPPCSVSFKENVEFALYYCPVTWTRRNAAYLGVYADKAVRKIGRISKVVACEVDPDSDTVRSSETTARLTRDEERRILGATRAALKHSWDLRTGTKFFLCDELVDTDFRKESPGGIRGHLYFDLRDLLHGKVPEDINELAALLCQQTWK